MRLVKIVLSPETPFWFLGPINLTEKKKESDYIDIDSLTNDDRKVINASALARSIRLLDVTGQRIHSTDECVLSKTAFSVDTSDIEEEEIPLPEIATVTVSDTPDPPALPVSLEGPTESDVKDAKILIERKGNTIKKIIKGMGPSKKNTLVLMAAEELEQTGKNREGILSCIRETLGGWQDGRAS